VVFILINWLHLFTSSQRKNQLSIGVDGGRLPMLAMVLERICRMNAGTRPLARVDLPRPTPGPGEVLLEVSACGVCHTELDEIEGRTPPSRLPMVPGHQVVGRVVESGVGTSRFSTGDRVGVAWIFNACGKCALCRSGRENLCHRFIATGRDAHGGYAEFIALREDFALPLPAAFSDVEAAPLLCAGAIGYRSLRLTGLTDGQRLGLTGFGASAHLVLKMVAHRFPASPVYVFARSAGERNFARELGAVWAGDTREMAPEKLDCIIDTTPAWTPVVWALANLAPGGRLVINAIRKEDGDQSCLQALDYPRHLWMEKEIKSVANVTRADVTEFLHLAAEIPIRPQVQTFPLIEANTALQELKQGRIRGAKVLDMNLN
jgi:propanol-preferring alcohol dehydrogenase